MHSLTQINTLQTSLKPLQLVYVYKSTYGAISAYRLYCVGLYFQVFRLRHLTNRKLKIPDVFTLFLILGMQIFSKNVTSISIIPYYLLIISGLALILLLLDLFYYKQFAYRRFLKLWWRLTFFITLIIYLILVVMTFTH